MKLKKKPSKTGKPSWLLKLHHATINKSVFLKKEERTEKRLMKERLFCVSVQDGSPVKV